MSAALRSVSSASPKASISRFWVFPVVFSEHFALGMVRPELPQILFGWFSGDLARAALFQGATEAVGAILAFLCTPLLGKLSDQYGRRIPLLLTAILTCLPVLVLAAAVQETLLTSNQSIILYAISLLFAKVNSYSIALSYVADCTPLEHRSSAFGELSAMIFLSVTLGPFLSTQFERRAALSIAGVICMATILYLAFVIPETRSQTGSISFGKDKDKDSKSASSASSSSSFACLPSLFPAFKFIASNSLYKLLAVVTFVSQFVVFGVGQVYFLYLVEELGFTRADNILAAIISGAETCVVMLGILPWLSRSWRPSSLIAFALVSYLVYALSLIFCVATKAQVFLLIFLWALSGMLYPTLSALLSQSTPDSALGLSQGSMAAIRALASGLGPAAFGIIFSSSLNHKHALLGPGHIDYSHDTASFGSGFFTLRYVTLPFLFGALLIVGTLVASLYLPTRSVRRSLAKDGDESDDEIELNPLRRLHLLDSDGHCTLVFFAGNHHTHHDGLHHLDSHHEDHHAPEDDPEAPTRGKSATETAPLLGKTKKQPSQVDLNSLDFAWKPRSAGSRRNALIFSAIFVVAMLWGITAFERFQDSEAMPTPAAPSSAFSLAQRSSHSDVDPTFPHLPNFPFSLISLVGEGGVGKTSYANLLGPALGLGHISTGVLLRKEIAANTTLGQRVVATVRAGKLVDDLTVFSLVTAEIHRLQSAGYRGVMLDGFPRTVSQAKLLPDKAEHLPGIAAAVYFTMREEVLLKRVSGRRVCPVCGATYNLAGVEDDSIDYHLPPNNPKSLNPLVCDNDGHALESRPDDQPAIVHERHEVFVKETMPLIEYFASEGVEIEWEVNRDAKEVLPALVHRIVNQIQRFSHSRSHSHN